MNVYLFEIILATGLLFLFATVLGTMREAVILRGDVAALAQLITKPPLPSYLGEVVPAAIAEEIGGRIGFSCDPPRAHVLLFLRDGCSGCEGLLGDVREAVGRGTLSPVDISAVVSAASHDAPVVRAAEAVSGHVTLDERAVLFTAAEVRGAPTLLAIWTDSLRAFDCEIGGDVGWIHERLQQRPDNAILMQS